MAKHVHVAHDGEKRQQSEYDVELHSLGVGVLIVPVFRLSEYKRLVGVAESLRNHDHYHGYFDTCAVYSELCSCLFGSAVVNVREYYLRRTLVQLPCQTHYQEWESVAKHAPARAFVEAVAYACKFFPEQKQGDNGANKVDIEHPNHVEREVCIVYSERIEL